MQAATSGGGVVVMAVVQGGEGEYCNGGGRVYVGSSQERNDKVKVKMGMS